MYEQCVQMTATKTVPITPAVRPMFLKASGIARIPVPRDAFSRCVRVSQSLQHDSDVCCGHSGAGKGEQKGTGKTNRRRNLGGNNRRNLRVSNRRGLSGINARTYTHISFHSTFRPRSVFVCFV